MKSKPKLSLIPGSELEQAIGFNLRHKTGVEPFDYLKQFLEIARQYGYATSDESWGELEKELQIAFRNLEQYRRYFDSSVHALMIAGDHRGYDEIADDLLDRGERFWADIQQMKEMVEIFSR